ARRGRRGDLLQLLRPGVLRPALVADDEPPPGAALQLRADPRRGVLGGGPALDDPPAAPALAGDGGARPGHVGDDRATRQPVGPAAARPGPPRSVALRLRLTERR